MATIGASDAACNRAGGEGRQGGRHQSSRAAPPPHPPTIRMRSAASAQSPIRQLRPSAVSTLVPSRPPASSGTGPRPASEPLCALAFTQYEREASEKDALIERLKADVRLCPGVERKPCHGLAAVLHTVQHGSTVPAWRWCPRWCPQRTTQRCPTHSCRRPPACYARDRWSPHALQLERPEPSGPHKPDVLLGEDAAIQ